MQVDLETNSIIQAFIQDQVKFPHQFLGIIHADDEMYLYSLKNLNGDRDAAFVRYYSLGKRIFDAVNQIVEWHFQTFDNLSSFLDFACGYGRFTRFLLQELTPDQIWVSDLYPEAVKFQMEQFGVKGIFSTEYPADYTIEQKFDCILASSFFSHVPKITFATWLEKLYSLLAPNGILMFSVHDIALMLPVEVAVNGIYFTPQSESKSLNKQLYGTTYVSEEFINQVINQTLGKEAKFIRIKKGICGNQDLYVIVKNKSKKFSELNFSYHPDGRVDYCNFTSAGELELSGWAADFNQDSRIEDIQIIVNGQILQRGLPYFERPDVAEYFHQSDVINSGWLCYLGKNTVKLDDVILVKAINSRKLERVIAANTLKSLLK
jgi:SAM-dependent methyltransferase